MFSRSIMHKAVLAALIAAGASGAAHAQKQEEEPSLDRLLGLVGAALPPVIGDSNSGLVEALLSADLGTPLSKSFNFNTARGGTFGARITPAFGPDCQRTGTPTGDPDQGECTATTGQEGGGEAFKSLSFSKNLGVGNIRYLSRPRVVDLKPGDLKPVKMSNPDAYGKAVEFLGKYLGLPTNEIPTPPNGELVPVKDLTIGFDKGAGQAPVVVQKVVYLRRGLKLKSPFVDPQTKRELTYVPAPGLARVAMDADGQVTQAVISNWQELRRSDQVDPRNAKTRDQLVQEIARNLLAEGGGNVASLKILIGMSSEFRGTYGLLLPAVQVYVSPGGRDTEPPGATTAGYVREFALVDAADRTNPR